MLNWNTLQDRPRDFLAATGLTLVECAPLLPAFQAAHDQRSPPDVPCAGKPRQRRAGGGAQGVLDSAEDQLLLILAYEKPHPLHTRHGWQCGVRQPQTHSWMHRVFPVLPD